MSTYRMHHLNWAQYNTDWVFVYSEKGAVGTEEGEGGAITKTELSIFCALTFPSVYLPSVSKLKEHKPYKIKIYKKYLPNSQIGALL